MRKTGLTDEPVSESYRGRHTTRGGIWAHTPILSVVRIGSVTSADPPSGAAVSADPFQTTAAGQGAAARVPRGGRGAAHLVSAAMDPLRPTAGAKMPLRVGPARRTLRTSYALTWGPASPRAARSLPARDRAPPPRRPPHLDMVAGSCVRVAAWRRMMSITSQDTRRDPRKTPPSFGGGGPAEGSAERVGRPLAPP